MVVERTLKCPSCGGSLRASRFARRTTCPYCEGEVILDPSVVSVARYREAFAEWDARPDDAGVIGAEAWRIERRIARGLSCDVHLATRVRAPGHRAVVKVLRDSGHAPLLRREVETLRAMSAVDGNGALAARIPRVLGFGVVEGGAWHGRLAAVIGATPGFRRTLAAVVRRGSVSPVASVWVWRRLLEALAALHRAGFAHGAMLPAHVLLEDDDHGARLVGWSAAGPIDTPLPFRESRWSAHYPGVQLTALADVAMSARLIAWALKGDPGTGKTAAPAPYAEVIRLAAAGEFTDAWALRTHLGSVAKAAFGAPSFHPLAHAGD